MKALLWLSVAVTLLSCSACQQLLPALPTGQQTAALLYKDDFSNLQSGWKQAASQNGTADYADGVYRIQVKQANNDVWASPGLDLGDTRVEVDAIKVGGDRNNRFGIVCRMSPAGFYIFLISSDGYYGIGKVKNSQYQLLGSSSLLPDAKIPQGSAYLHLRADCVQDRLALFVNGEKITEARDPELPSGDVGLIAGAYSEAGAEILFDNFNVFKP